ncbi:unnamed protein product, partial [Allacma fusca]
EGGSAGRAHCYRIAVTVSSDPDLDSVRSLLISSSFQWLLSTDEE